MKYSHCHNILDHLKTTFRMCLYYKCQANCTCKRSFIFWRIIPPVPKISTSSWRLTAKWVFDVWGNLSHSVRETLFAFVWTRLCLCLWGKYSVATWKRLLGWDVYIDFFLHSYLFWDLSTWQSHRGTCRWNIWCWAASCGSHNRTWPQTLSELFCRKIIIRKQNQ